MNRATSTKRKLVQENQDNEPIPKLARVELNVPRLKKNRLQALLDPELQDVQFKVGDKYFNASKVMLASSSEVFKVMFYSDLKEKNFPIKIIDITPGAFGVMLKYIYCHELILDSVKKALECLQAAKKYLLPDLMEELENYLANHLTISNFFDVFDSAKLFECKTLIRQCKLKFQESANEILNSKELLKTNLSSLEELFELDNLKNSSEVDLICALNTYICHHKLIRTETSPNADLDRVIRHLRFSSIPHKILVPMLVNFNWLTPNEKFGIIANQEAKKEVISLDAISYNIEDRNLGIRIKELKAKLQIVEQRSKQVKFCDLCHETHLYNLSIWSCRKVTEHKTGAQRLAKLNHALTRIGITNRTLTAILEAENQTIFLMLHKLLGATSFDLFYF